MSQSLVNENAGARTPLSGLFSAFILLAVALFFSDLLRALPQPVLGAVVLMAVAGLVKIPVLVQLWKVHRGEFLVAAAALAGVLSAGLLQGVLIGAVISLVMLVRRAAHPRVAFLGRIPGTDRYSDMARHASNEPVPGILAFRIVEARSSVRDMLRAEGLEEAVGRIDRFTARADAIGEARCTEGNEGP